MEYSEEEENIPEIKLLSETVIVKRPEVGKRIYVYSTFGSIFVTDKMDSSGYTVLLLEIKNKTYNCYSFRTYHNISLSREIKDDYLNIYIASDQGIIATDNRYFITEVLFGKNLKPDIIFKKYYKMMLSTKNEYVAVKIVNGRVA